MTDDLVKRLREEVNDHMFGIIQSPLQLEAADRIEQLETGFRNILIQNDPIFMQMIAKACLTGAIDEQGKYCFVPPFALGEKNK